MAAPRFVQLHTMNSTNNPLPGIAVFVDSDLADGLDNTPGAEWMTAAVRWGLAQATPPDTIGQVSLLITDDATVQALNKQYRGLDATTDVLSFSAEYGGHWEGDEAQPDSASHLPSDWPLPGDEPPPLGDIVISLPQAARQADQQGVPLCSELALLLVHGALHLLGHDHYEDRERDEMQRLERLALDAFFGSDEA